MREISNSDDMLSGRDIIKRHDELESERHDLEAAIDEAQDEYNNADVSAKRDGVDFVDGPDLERAIADAKEALKQWDVDYGDDLKALKEIYDQVSRDSTLIRDSYFKRYAQDLADEIGAVDSDAGWPNSCIDWDKATDELQMDYSSIEWDGVTYWVRD